MVETGPLGRCSTDQGQNQRPGRGASPAYPQATAQGDAEDQSEANGRQRVEKAQRDIVQKLIVYCPEVYCLLSRS